MADVPQRAGWYPDPDGAPGERWWNGAGWSDSRRGGVAAPAPAPAPAPASVAAPVVYSAENPAPQAPGQYASSTRAAITINARVNPMALYGFIAGFFAIFFNFLLVPAALAIVFSARGLSRAKQLQAAGETSTLRTFAIAGLAMGIIGAALGLFQAGLVLWGIIGSFSVNIT